MTCVHMCRVAYVSFHSFSGNAGQRSLAVLLSSWFILPSSSSNNSKRSFLLCAYGSLRESYRACVLDEVSPQSRKVLRRPSTDRRGYSISKRIIGRVFDRLLASLNPAALNAEGTPCQRNGSGIFSIVGSTG